MKRNALRGRQIRESSLAASGFIAAAGAEASDCTPGPLTFENCASKTIRLRQKSRVLAVGTGGQVSDGGTPTGAYCQVRVDDRIQAFSANPGEVNDNTSGSSANGFARTLVTAPLPPGPHTVALACEQNGGNPVRIDSPTIAAIAVGSR